MLVLRALLSGSHCVMLLCSDVSERIKEIKKNKNWRLNRGEVDDDAQTPLHSDCRPVAVRHVAVDFLCSFN